MLEEKEFAGQQYQASLFLPDPECSLGQERSCPKYWSEEITWKAGCSPQDRVQNSAILLPYNPRLVK